MMSRLTWVRSCLLLLVLVSSVAPGSISRLVNSGPIFVASRSSVPSQQSGTVPEAEEGLSDLAAGDADHPILPGAPPEIQAIIDQITVSGFSGRVATLSTSFGSRLYRTSGNDETVNYIRSFFQNVVGLETSLNYFGSGGSNVVGTLLAGSATNQEVIVVGAHLDSYPISSPGADDDASGVATVMEIAQAMAQYQYNRTIIFVAFNSEEQGLVGSNAYANTLVNQNASVAVVYNFDMTIWNNPEAPADEKVQIVHNGGTSGTFAAQAAARGQTWLGAPIKAFLSPMWTMSDHAPFWSRGYPAIWFFECGGLGNPKIHSMQDSWTDPAYSYEQGCTVARTAAAALADFATIVSTQPGFPQTTFVSPSPEGYLEPAGQLPIVLSIEDAYHDVDRVELSINGGDWLDVSAGLNATHCTYLWNASAAYGPVTLRARVYDAAGWLGRASGHFTVDRGVNCVIVAPSPGETIAQGSQYTIRVNASDVDGRALTNTLVRVNASSWNVMMPSGSGSYAYNWTVTGWGPVIIEARAVDQNGRGNYSQVAATVVRYAPVVSSVSWTPLQPTDADRIRFTAQVFQDARGSGIKLVLVFYSVNSEPWATRLMTTTSATGYAGTLDPLPAGSSVRFYVQAADNVGNIVRDDNAGLYYGFTIVMTVVPLLVMAGGVAVIVASLVVSWLTLRRGRRRPRIPTR
jgi:aminopeptidase YwaD